MYSSYDHKWVDLGTASNNLCKGQEIPFKGVLYAFNKEGLLSASITEEEVDNLARHIATIYKLPYIVIVKGAGWYIKYNSASDILTDSSRISFCRVIERC
jgi:hypothetical protein